MSNDRFTQTYHEKLKRCAALIEEAESISLCGHINPDGDCIGSVLALYTILLERGKIVTPLLAERKEPPHIFSYLDGFDCLIPAADYVHDDDLFIMLDVSTLSRLGDGVLPLGRAKHSILLDHHPDTALDADEVISDSTKAATGMLVWDLVTYLTDIPSRACAQCCLTALITDTGRFQYQNTSAESFEYARDFVTAGASPSLINECVYQSKPFGLLLIERAIIDRIVFSEQGTVALSWVDVSDFKQCHVSPDEAESLSDVIRSISGVRVCVLLRGNHNETRCNIRSKGNFDISVFAQYFGGGGHRAASGMMFEKPVSETVELLKTYMPLIEQDILLGHEAPTFLNGA